MNQQLHASRLAAYHVVSTQTATPAQLILMLYDGALRFLGQARAAFAFDDPLEFNQTIHNNIAKTQAIIAELNACLDLDKGKDCALNFRRLYDYLDRRLDEANRRKEEKGIIEVIQRVTVLRDAWAEMMQSAGKPPSSAHGFSGAVPRQESVDLAG